MVAGTGGQVQPANRLFEQAATGGIQAGHLFQAGLPEAGIGLAAAGQLPPARGNDACPDLFRRFRAGAFGEQFILRQARHLDMQVDAVQERTGQARAVAGDGFGINSTPRAVAVVATGQARGCQQLETGETRPGVRPEIRCSPIAAACPQHIALPFGHQEQHAGG